MGYPLDWLKKQEKIPTLPQRNCRPCSICFASRAMKIANVHPLFSWRVLKRSTRAAMSGPHIAF